jgi:hypothetical protein
MERRETVIRKTGVHKTIRMRHTKKKERTGIMELAKVNRADLIIVPTCCPETGPAK